ncbi:MAG TPA: 3-oxoacyl-[acyl-carrier-protein] synthase III C-terminal domain-containing protein [Kineosporiaceae bacterium]
MRFLSITHELPSRVVTNDEVVAGVRAASAAHLTPDELHTLDQLLGQLFASTGTTVRFHRAEGERALDVALRAARRAIAESGLDPLDIDLLIYVGIGRGVLEPASGTVFQDLLGLRHATTFDVLDACASWMRALHLAKLYLDAGVHRNVMIVNAEFEGREAHRLELRSLAEFEHWHPSVTIGEGSTATILTREQEPDDLMIDFRTWGEARGLCFIPLPNVEEYFGQPIAAKHRIEPLQFVSFGLRLMQYGADRLIDHYRSRPEFKDSDPQIVFGHAASDGMTRYIAQEVGADLSRIRMHHKDFANCVSASIPLAMSHALAQGALTEGMRVLLMMASAGVTTGLAAFTFHGPATAAGVAA